MNEKSNEKIKEEKDEILARILSKVNCTFPLPKIDFSEKKMIEEFNFRLKKKIEL